MNLAIALLLHTARGAVQIGADDGKALVGPAGATWMATPQSAASNCGCKDIQYGSCYPRSSTTHIADPVPHKDQCRDDQAFIVRNHDSTQLYATCEDKNDNNAGERATMTYYGMCYDSTSHKAYGALWAADCEDSESFYSVPTMYGPGMSSYTSFASKYDCTNTQIGWCYVHGSPITTAVDASSCSGTYLKPRSSMVGTASTISGDTVTRAAHGFSVGDRFKFKADTLPTVGGVNVKTHTGDNADDEWYLVESTPTANTFKVATAAAPTVALTFDGAGVNVKFYKPAFLCDKSPSTAASSNIVQETYGNCYTGTAGSPAFGDHKVFCGLTDYYCTVDLDYSPTPSPTPGPTPAPTQGWASENAGWLSAVVGVAVVGLLGIGYAYKVGKLQGMLSWKMFSSSLPVERTEAELAPSSRAKTPKGTRV